MSNPSKLSNVLRAEHYVQNLQSSDALGDIGCWGWRYREQANAQGFSYCGVDREVPPNKPENAHCFGMQGIRLLVPDESFDLTIASHVIEHLDDPYNFVNELLRVTKPGGLIWIEAPSELSLLMTEQSAPEDNAFESFYTDPTHKQPYPPGAFYRLALANHLVPLGLCRDVADFGTCKMPVSRLLAKRPVDLPLAVIGNPRYATFRDAGMGLEAAWRALWSKDLPN